ncbi:unnamed protein product [Discosporangium mesarthrocarpum]
MKWTVWRKTRGSRGGRRGRRPSRRPSRKNGKRPAVDAVEGSWCSRGRLDRPRILLMPMAHECGCLCLLDAAVFLARGPCGGMMESKHSCGMYV